MSNNIIIALELIVLVLSLLNVCQNIFKVAKVVRLKQGQVELNTYGSWTLGLSISYIITVLILGF